MLLQLNSELRYRRKNLETALFADIGNSWNTYASAAFPGGQFRLSKFHRELGFGSGLGLRYFYSLLVFRLDMGYALHDPSRPLGERWISDFGLDRLRFAFAFGQAF
jgi:outer membrane protein assembly factor BamA